MKRFEELLGELQSITEQAVEVEFLEWRLKVDVARAALVEYVRERMEAKRAADAENVNLRVRIGEWLRTTPRAHGVLISINSSQDIARLADDIESGRWEVPR